MLKPRQLPKGRKSEEPLTGMCTRNMSFLWLELFLLLLLLEASFFLSMAVLPMPSSPKRGAERWIWRGRLLFHLSPPSHGPQLVQAPYFLFSFLSLSLFFPPFLMALGNLGKRGGGEAKGGGKMREAEGRGGVSPAPVFNPSSEVSGETFARA